MAGNAARKRELQEELLQPRFILTDVRIDLAVGSLQVCIADHRRTSVSRTGNVDHVEVMRFDDTVQVRVNEVLPRRGAPVPEQHALHIREHERASEQRIVEHPPPTGELVRRAPIGVDLVKQIWRESVGFHRQKRVQALR